MYVLNCKLQDMMVCRKKFNPFRKVGKSQRNCPQSIIDKSTTIHQCNNCYITWSWSSRVNIQKTSS